MKYYESHGLEKALQKLKAMSESITTSTACSEIPGCQEKVRKTILQLGNGLGLGHLAAGLFLANHYSFIGPYFGSTDGPDWPHFWMFQTVLYIV